MVTDHQRLRGTAVESGPAERGVPAANGRAAHQRWPWLALAALIAAALMLRLHDLSRIFLWLDETDFFNEHLFGAHPESLPAFALGARDATTNTMGWPAIIWIVCHLFGTTLSAARAGAVIAGTAAVGLIFLLVYRLLSPVLGTRRFIASFVAAVLAATSVAQIDFSQRTYPYGATTFAAAALIIAHFELLKALTNRAKRLEASAALYTCAAVFAVFIHPSLDVLLGISIIFLLIHAVRERARFLRAACWMVPILGLAVWWNAKNPNLGHRLYLPQYYHQPDSIAGFIRVIPRLAGHAYDLIAYHLNLFYNASLYWPEKINWALFPLVLLCLTGWAFAWSGRFGVPARHAAKLALAITAALALLSMKGLYPFGGVRQTLFLSPFLFAFTGLGALLLLQSRMMRIGATAAAVAYLALWAVNLPRFYQERVADYSADDIVQAWRQNGRIPVYTRGSERELYWVMRNHPEVEIHSLAPKTPAPYLLVATHWPPLQDPMYFGYPRMLDDLGYKATMVLTKPAFHLDSLRARTSLYFPPNSFWVYKVTAR